MTTDQSKQVVEQDQYNSVQICHYLADKYQFLNRVAALPNPDIQDNEEGLQVMELVEWDPYWYSYIWI